MMATVVENGVTVKANAATGLPYDNKWHTDVNKWSEAVDNLGKVSPQDLVGSLYLNLVKDPKAALVLKKYGYDISDWDYVAFDGPGVGKMKPGDTVDRKWSQQVFVLDKGTRAIVAHEDAGPGAPFRVVGSYPNNIKLKP